MNRKAIKSARLGGPNAVLAVVTAMTGIAAIGLVSYLQPSTAVAASPDVTQSAVATTFVRCGLTAEALAAAGVDAPKASQVRAAMVAKLEGDKAALDLATETLASARAALDTLRRAAQGEPSDQQAALISGAVAALADAETSNSAVIAQFVSAATADLSNAQKESLSVIRANAARTLPAPYLVHSMDDEAYVRLRDALAAERTAQKLEEEVPADAAAHLATVRAVPSVAAALSNTDANLAAIRAALAGG